MRLSAEISQSRLLDLSLFLYFLNSFYTLSLPLPGYLPVTFSFQHIPTHTQMLPLTPTQSYTQTSTGYFAGEVF